MRILCCEMQYGPVRQNKGMLNKLPVPIVKWYRKARLDKRVSFVSGCYLSNTIYVRLISGEEMYWDLDGHYYLMKHRPGQNQMKAIKLSDADLAKMVEVEENKALLGLPSSQN